MENKYHFARKLVLEAGNYIRQHLSADLVIEEKTQHDDLVTSMDKSVQEFLVNQILETYPKDFILAEEGNLRHSVKKGNVWVIDPIDGTINFIVQKESFTLMLSYWQEGKGQFAFIYDVMSDKLLEGGANLPVSLQGQVLSQITLPSLSKSLMASNASMFAQNFQGLQNLIKHTLGVRVLGGAGISMMGVLEGRFLAYFSHLYPWDYLAPMILGKELGYQLLTLEGQEPDFEKRQFVMFVPTAYLEDIQSYLK